MVYPADCGGRFEPRIPAVYCKWRLAVDAPCYYCVLMEYI